MIPPPNNWIEFTDGETKLEYMKRWKLAPPTTTYSRALTYRGGYVNSAVNCAVKGRVGENTVVISVLDRLHCVNSDCLSEMQVGLLSSAAPESFVVLDLETSGLNPRTDKIIEIAAIKYEDGKEAGIFESLVNPCCEIHRDITNLTGITGLDLIGSPCIEQVLPSFFEFLGDLPIVAHNAAFDVSFLSSACLSIGVNFSNKSIDTLRMSRRAFPELEKHSLDYLKNMLNIQVATSHRALPDVRATATLYSMCLDMLKTSREESRESSSVAHRHRAQSKSLHYSDEQRKTVFSNNRIKIDEVIPDAPINSAHPLYGKNVVFTGELSIDRRAAMQFAVNAGAVIKSSVSQKTDFLVVGKQDVSLVGEDGMSTKEEKAHQINAGCKATIRILSESEFLRLVE